MQTELERVLAEMNGNVFLREYTFATNQFKSACGQEYELADHVVILPGAILVFQAKERDKSADNSDEAIEKWFKREVLKNACRQLADTRSFFQKEPDLCLPNQRGHVRDLANPSDPIIQVALYALHGKRPALLTRTSHRQSSKAGFVHILDVQDYLETIRVLALPAEIADYFAFREDCLLRGQSWEYDEARLVAAFILEQSPSKLKDGTVRNVLADALHDVESFDLGNMLVKYGEKVFYYEGGGPGADYYAILNEFAHMNRVHMRSFRRLRDWALGKAGSDSAEVPVRMLVPSRGTGFVVFPVATDDYPQRLVALRNLTLAAKYDWRLPREVGVAIARRGQQYEIDWAFVQFPWQPDQEMERLLAQNHPFRPAPEPKVDYRYRESRSF